jgi:hypothetical protein
VIGDATDEELGRSAEAFAARMNTAAEPGEGWSVAR